MCQCQIIRVEKRSETRQQQSTENKNWNILAKCFTICTAQVTVPSPPPRRCPEIHLTNVQRSLSNCLLKQYIEPSLYDQVPPTPSSIQSSFIIVLLQSTCDRPLMLPSLILLQIIRHIYKTQVFKWNIHSDLIEKVFCLFYLAPPGSTWLT